MATVQDIITGAATELGALPLGDTLDANEAARGLIVLQSMFRESVEKGVFGRLGDYLATDDYEAKEQERVYSAGFTITLPTTITDTWTGDDRRPKDLAMIQVVNASSAPQISLYDASLAAWVRIDNLTLAGTCPLGTRYQQGLECALAYRLAATFKKAVPQSVAGYSAGLSSALSLRQSAPRTTTQAEFY